MKSTTKSITMTASSHPHGCDAKRSGSPTFISEPQGNKCHNQEQILGCLNFTVRREQPIATPLELNASKTFKTFEVLPTPVPQQILADNHRQNRPSGRQIAYENTQYRINLVDAPTADLPSHDSIKKRQKACNHREFPILGDKQTPSFNTTRSKDTLWSKTQAELEPELPTISGSDLHLQYFNKNIRFCEKNNRSFHKLRVQKHHEEIFDDILEFLAPRVDNEIITKPQTATMVIPSTETFTTIVPKRALVSNNPATTDDDSCLDTIPITLSHDEINNLPIEKRARIFKKQTVISPRLRVFKPRPVKTPPQASDPLWIALPSEKLSLNSSYVPSFTWALKKNSPYLNSPKIEKSTIKWIPDYKLEPKIPVPSERQSLNKPQPAPRSQPETKATPTPTPRPRKTPSKPKKQAPKKLLTAYMSPNGPIMRYVNEIRADQASEEDLFTEAVTELITEGALQPSIVPKVSVQEPYLQEATQSSVVIEDPVQQPQSSQCQIIQFPTPQIVLSEFIPVKGAQYCRSVARTGSHCAKVRIPFKAAVLPTPAPEVSLIDKLDVEITADGEFVVFNGVKHNLAYPPAESTFKTYLNMARTNVTVGQFDVPLASTQAIELLEHLVDLSQASQQLRLQREEQAGEYLSLLETIPPPEVFADNNDDIMSWVDQILSEHEVDEPIEIVPTVEATVELPLVEVTMVQLVTELVTECCLNIFRALGGNS